MLKIIVAIFATFLSTELYAFEVPAISCNKFSKETTRKNCKTIHVVCYALYTHDYMVNNL